MREHVSRVGERLVQQHWSMEREEVTGGLGTGGEEGKRTGGQDDMNIGGQNDRRAEGREDRGT